MFTWFAAALRLPALPRRSEVTDRATVLALFGRFTDEVCSGLLIVLMPTLRLRFGLSVQQVGWCFQALSSVAALADPISGAAIDVVRRRPLLVWGAAGWGGALLLAGGAHHYGWLLAAFALAGAASGPLAQTADVVLVETHPDAVERIASRSTWLDTIGALLAPVAVTLGARAGTDARILLASAGLGAVFHALLLAGTAIPRPALRPDGTTALAGAVGNVREVLIDPHARRWLGAAALFELLDPLEMFEPVWLSSTTGASQAFVGVHLTVGLVASLVGLSFLDRWLAAHDAGPVLVAACLASLVLYPAWFLVPGIAAKLVMVIPREIAMAPLWPILRSRALAALPGKAGTTAALTALLGLVPINAVVGWVAARIGLTPTLLTLTITGLSGLLAVLRGVPPTSVPES